MLQERELQRVGDTRTVQVNTRVIAASNHDLLELADQGQFRKDLYYRLNVVPITLPPLRERAEDVPELVTHFLSIYNEQNDRYVVHIDPSAMDALCQYHWPGNVRELQNYIERAVVMAPGDELTCDLLPSVVTHGHGDRSIDRSIGKRGLDVESLTEELVQMGLGAAADDARDLHGQIVDRVEREVIAQVMVACEHVQTKAATRLGINRNTLHKKLKQYDLGGQS